MHYQHAQGELAEHQITANPPEDHVIAAAISPNGKHIAYSNPTGLYLRSVDSEETRAISLPPELQNRIWEVKWFSDGSKLLAEVNATEGFDIWAITILGEVAPRLLYRHGGGPAISPDGQSIAFERAEGIWVGGINGESPRELVSGKQNQVVFNPAWSPDGRWIAYVRNSKSARGSSISSVEIRPAGGGPAKSLATESTLPGSDLYVNVPRLAWSPDWRLIFNTRKLDQGPSGQEKYSLWEIPVGPRTGEAAGKPGRLTQWSELVPVRPTITADGKRVAFLKERVWQDVYLGELGPDGTSMKPPRRFTLDDRGSHLQDWARDSKGIVFSSNRNSTWQIFSQSLNESVGKAIVQGLRGHLRGAAVSSDGSWILYDESAPGASPPVHRLMRRASAGGSPEMLLEGATDTRWDCWCPQRPGSPCVLSRQEGPDFVFYSLDPARGKGEKLGNIEVSAAEATAWNVAPDGSGLALVDSGKAGRIRVLMFRDGTWHDVSVEQGWGQLQSISWAANEKNFFVTSRLPNSYNLLHVTFTGKVKPLLQNDRHQYIYNPLPSPDGKYLAFGAQTRDSNVWLLENF
jgi:Tol biopolymer transport system component